MNARGARTACRRRMLPWLLAACWTWPVAAAAAEAPDLALLEYLGDWQGAAGGELDPALLEALPPDGTPPDAEAATEDRRDEE
ncbi:MAG: hypothetical protein HY749_01350 [Gammaproteobacteria bacterium]|nr:hypothetical protein [Gammaproteobacteria bacterium]